MQSFDVGTLAGAGSFECEACGFAVALHERDELPECPRCGGEQFRRASMFSPGETGDVEAVEADLEPDWLAAARDALVGAGDVAAGDYLAVDLDDRVRVLPLADGWTRIGRSLSADVRLDDPTVSRRHALVYRDPDGAKVLDDRSLNGVFRNGERVDLAQLGDGDVLGVGRFALHFIHLARDREELAV
jgi:predicted  nucleic acid-binding Zn-ribbon protein